MTKRALIVFHSVCGNTYLMAKAYQKAFEANGVEVELYKVEDRQFGVFSDQFEASRETKAEIEAVPVITDCTEALSFDYIVMGSPTYFGNVSGPMKLFMDSFIPLFVESKLFGKQFAAFAACSTSTGGADMCLLALNNFALHLGMKVQAVPANIAGVSQPAYGIMHCAGGDSLQRPSAETIIAIGDYVKRLVELP